MLLHQLTIEGWRNLRESITLAELSRGLNVVFGPNETGKSTVMDAVCRGFFDRHGTGGDMQRQQPWGTRLAPQIEIEFEISGARYQITKRFLEGPASTLKRMHNGSWERIAQGATADEQILDLMSGQGVGRGLTKPEHWGLNQVLWCSQGQGTLITVGEQQQARLREALKITLNSTQGNTIEEAIGARYDAIFTPTGQYRDGERNRAEVLKLKAELEQAQAAVNELQQQRAQSDELEHSLQEWMDRRDTLVSQRRENGAALEKARRRMLDLAKQQRDYEQLLNAARHANATWETINTTVRAIRNADDAVRTAEESLREQEGKTRGAQAGMEAKQEATRLAGGARDAASIDLKRVEDALAGAERLVSLLEKRDQSESLLRQIEKIEKLVTRTSEARAALAGLRAPTPEMLKSLRKLDGQIREQQTLLDVASLTVAVEPDRPLDVAIELDGKAAQQHRVEQAWTVKALSTATFTIEGVGRIKVRGGESDVSELAEKLETLNAQWRGQVAALAASDLPALETLAADRATLDAKVTEWTAALAEEPKQATLKQQAAELDQSLRVLLLEDPTLEQTSGTIEQAQRARKTLKAEKKAAAARAAEAETALQSAQKEQAESAKAHNGAFIAQAEAQAVVTERQREAGRLRQEDGRSDVDRAAALGEALTGKDAAEQRLALATKPPVDDLQADITAMERSELADAHESTRLEENIGRVKGQMETLGAMGLYSRWAEAQERVDAIQPRLTRAQLEAEAVKLLWETLQKHKSQIFEAVLRPVRGMVQTSLQRLVGPRYDHVDFDERLMPSKIQPRLRETAAEISDLSFGTREQLMLLVRLSLGRLLSRSELGPQCVILDDPLVNADPARQRAALRIIEEAAREMQVIVFTCHPSSYDSPAAKRFDLEALVAGSNPPAAMAADRREMEAG